MRIGIIVLHYCLFGTFTLFAQTHQEDPYAGPLDGDPLLCTHFYKINFTDAQRKELCQFRWNILLSIDETGKAHLLEFEPNGNKNPDIVDSLAKACFNIPGKFHPRIQNGQPVSFIYSLNLLFHCPGNNQNLLRAPFPKDRFTDGNVKSFHKSSKRWDLLLAFLANQPAGNMARYLDPGIGLKIDIMVPCSGVNLGLVTAFIENERKLDYPKISASKQDNSTSLFLMGPGINRNFVINNQQEFMVQLELMYAGQTIIHANNNDPIGTTVQGWSPGLMLNYLLRVGKNQFWNTRTSEYAIRRPSIAQNYLNIHSGFRLMDFPAKEASGWVYEIGIGFRLSQSLLKDYELK